MIESSRGAIDYDESGTGPTNRPCAGIMQYRRRVTTSLLGYGRTAERRTPADADISHEAEVVESVVARTGGPVHLVGHSFGGLTALAVALRNRVPLLSLVIIEAPAPEVLRQTGEHQHYQSFREMSEAYIGAFEAGNGGAIELMIDFYGGSGTFAAWPERVRGYARQTTAVNILDWQTAYGFPLPTATLARVEVPTLVLCGGASHPPIRRANELLVQGMSNASLATLARAAHFMISTHPQEVAGMIAHHVADTELGRPESLRRLASAAAEGDPPVSVFREQAVQWPAAHDPNSRP